SIRNNLNQFNLPIIDGNNLAVIRAHILPRLDSMHTTLIVVHQGPQRGILCAAECADHLQVSDLERLQQLLGTVRIWLNIAAFHNLASLLLDLLRRLKWRTTTGCAIGKSLISLELRQGLNFSFGTSLDLLHKLIKILKTSTATASGEAQSQRRNKQHSDRRHHLPPCPL